MAEPLYQIATYNQNCTMAGRINFELSEGPGFDGTVDRDNPDVGYTVGTEPEIIEDSHQTIKVLRLVGGSIPQFRRMQARAILEWFDAEAAIEDGGE